MPAAPPPDRILTGFLAVYHAAELELLNALAVAARRGAASEDLTTQLVEAHRVRERTERIATRLDNHVRQASRDTLTDAMIHGGRTAIADLDALLGLGRDYGDELNRGALDTLARSLSDTLTPVHRAVTRAVADAYKGITGEAAVGVLTGTATRLQVTQRALDRYADRGITGFRDRAGRLWGLDTYSEMAVRAATARASVDAHTARLAEAGVELVSVSNSPQECPRCRPWEGKILSTSGRGARTIRVRSVTTHELIEIDVSGSVDEARADGLLHPNCTHSLSAYLPGASTLLTTTENPRGYEDRQRLRHLERRVRAAKRQEAAAMTPGARAAARAKVLARQAAIREHVVATGAKRQPAREQLMTGRTGRGREGFTPPVPPSPSPRGSALGAAAARRALTAGEPAEALPKANLTDVERGALEDLDKPGNAAIVVGAMNRHRATSDTVLYRSTAGVHVPQVKVGVEVPLGTHPGGFASLESVPLAKGTMLEIQVPKGSPALNLGGRVLLPPGSTYELVGMGRGKIVVRHHPPGTRPAVPVPAATTPSSPVAKKKAPPVIMTTDQWQGVVAKARTKGTPAERITRALPQVAMVGMDRLNPVVQRGLADAVEDAVRVAPMLRSTVRSIRVADEPKNYGSFTFANRELFLNSKFFGSQGISDTNINAMREAERGFKIPLGGKSGIYKTVVHELGHAALRPREGKNAIARARDPWGYQNAADAIGKKADKLVGRNQTMAQALSAYGASDRQETIAEAFAEFVIFGPNARRVSRGVTNEVLSDHGTSVDDVLELIARPEPGKG